MYINNLKQLVSLGLWRCIPVEKMYVIFIMKMLLCLNSHTLSLPSGSTDSIVLRFHFTYRMKSSFHSSWPWPQRSGFSSRIFINTLTSGCILWHFLLPHNRPTILFAIWVFGILFTRRSTYNPMDIRNIIMSSNFSPIINFFHISACIWLQTLFSPRYKNILYKINILLLGTDAH